MKRVIKWGGIFVLTSALLITLLALLFYFPPFQNWAVRQASAYASAKTGMQISVGRVRLSFPFDLDLREVKVLEPNRKNKALTDTVADITSMVADVQLLPLLRKQVMVDRLVMSDMKVNTTHFIDNVCIKGDVGTLSLKAHGIDLSKEHVKLNDALLSNASLTVELSDTVPPDTTPSQNFWKISLDRLKLRNAALTVRMPGDTLSVNTLFNKAQATQVYLDLYKALYTVRHINWESGGLRYDQNFVPAVRGFDYNHLLLTGLALDADSFYYYNSCIDLKVRQGRFREKSGLTVDSLQGRFMMDSLRLSLPRLNLRTPGSQVAMNMSMDMNAFDNVRPGILAMEMHGAIGRQDLMLFMGGALPRKLAKSWPQYPLVINGKIRGNLQKMHLSGLTLKLPGSFNVTGDGFVENLMSTNRLRADIDLHARTQNLGFILSVLPREVTSMVRIPEGIAFKGRVNVNGNQYGSNFVATQGGGLLRGDVKFNAQRMAYQARLSANWLPLHHFLPRMGLRPFTGTANITGQGTDIMSPHTRLKADVKMHSFGYDKYDLSGITFTSQVANGHVMARINSKNKLLKGVLTVDALTKGRLFKGTFGCDLEKADLFKLHLVNEPLTVSLCGHVDITTNFKQYYKVQGLLSDMTAWREKRALRPDNIVFDLFTSKDTTHLVADCADFKLRMEGRGGYQYLLKRGGNFWNQLQHQLKSRHLNQVRLRECLPGMKLYVKSGRNNLVYRILKHFGFEVGKMSIDMESSAIKGLNGFAEIDSLVVDSFQVDTVRLALSSENNAMVYHLQMRNGKDNPRYVFNAFVDGALIDKGAYVKTRVYDENNKLGLSLAMEGTMERNGIRIKLFDDDPVLGYNKFAVNDSNYIFLGDDRRVSANVDLRSQNGMGLQIYSNDDNTEALQDVTIGLHRFDLGQLMSVIPYAPPVTGILDGDFHLVQTKKELTVSSAVNIGKMSYAGSMMGNVGTEFTYMPKEEGGHYVDGILTKDGREIGTLSGTYISKGKGYLDARLGLERMPMELVNGFVPDKLIGFKGYAEGTLSLKGSLGKPDVNGEVFLDSTFMYSEPYGVEVRFANDPVTITNSHLLFENFEIFSHNDSPLNVEGSFDFSDMSKMMLDVRMKAKNFLLIDSRENGRSEAFGKAYVDFMGAVKGPLDDLNMNGRLDVLGTTNLKYNLKDSPLSTDDQLNGLVEFVNLKDTLNDVVKRPPLTGFNIDLSINIDEGAHAECFLNADHSNYVDVIGGGTMRLKYNVADDISLRGRYTMSSGEMKYSLPVIPLKTFTITEGSYIEFTGDPYNPLLNLTATEQTKSTVGEGSNNGRSVNFTCGVVVTKRLKDMGLEFTIDAPEDMSIHNQLQSMTKEERGKLAVTMLTTGMYLADGNTKNFTMNSALSAFLNSQINQISGKALRSLDVSFGVDNSFNGNGMLHTDYSFKFAKRFWNNRLRIVIGGKLSSGADVVPQEQTFFDNVSFEYRLSSTSNKYLNLFYQRDSYDWLEGNVSKFGGGFMWRRKLSRLKDLFSLHDNTNEIPAIPADTTKKKIVKP